MKSILWKTYVIIWTIIACTVLFGITLYSVDLILNEKEILSHLSAYLMLYGPIAIYFIVSIIWLIKSAYLGFSSTYINYWKTLYFSIMLLLISFLLMPILVIYSWSLTTSLFANITIHNFFEMNLIAAQLGSKGAINLLGILIIVPPLVILTIINFVRFYKDLWKYEYKTSSQGNKKKLLTKALFSIAITIIILGAIVYIFMTVYFILYPPGERLNLMA